MLSHGKVLARDCVHVCRQLRLHYVEEQLVALSRPHCRIVVVSLRAPSCAFVVCSALSHVVLNRVELVQLLLLQLPVALELRAVLNELLDFLGVSDGYEWTISKLFHLL